ncbi:DUF2339 domain-containing protein [uncultured Williamsia sp.]|uniref:DUF2339 domain-containing protein n=1 Tax=uncultured Williamsia sp. TaxID=259311 RepID=UPI002637B481|nr:DUF2339 domain-containing protein [uncultured Williamsia sp.]
MTAPYPHPAHLQRLAQECAHLAHRTSQIAAELAAMQVAPVPAPVPAPPPAPIPPPHPYPATPPRRSWLSRAADDGRLVGAVLAVAGVAVTVVGVGLLLVLAAQAGLLRPEMRVAAGAVFAASLIGLATRSHARGSGVGAVALAATGIATAYLDVVAVTRLYHWVPVVVGLVLAAGLAGGGVAWARRWRSERLALVSVTPLIAVAPLVAGGIDLGLVGFMLVIAVACVVVAHRTPWSALPVVGVSAVSLWVTAVVVAARVAAAEVDGVLLALGCAATAAIGLAAGLSSVTRRVSATAAALASVVGCVPALVCGVALDRGVAASVLAAVATANAALVVWSAPSIVRATWACLAAVATVVAIPSAFGATVAVPALLAIAAVVTVVGRGDRLIAAVGAGLAVVGGLGYLGWSVPVESLLTPIARTDGQTASAVVASLLLVGAAAALGVVHRTQAGAVIAAGAVALYGLTATVVTVGVAVGGTGAGFLAGHMAATVLWVLAASAVLAVAARMPVGAARRAPIAAALTLAGAAVVKLVTFDLATLDGAFRVGAFVAAGIALLAVGAHHARARSTTSV